MDSEAKNLRPDDSMVLAGVGDPIAHESGSLHVSGRARYIDDMPVPDDCLHVAPGYANAAHGEIVDLDLEPVRASEGVVAVLTADDINGVNDCSPGSGDDPILADGQIQFHGQVVFIVVAKTRLQARRAARRAQIDIREQPAIVSIEDALQLNSDLLPEYEFSNCDPEELLVAADQRFSSSLMVGGQDHFYLEGQIALALPGENCDMLIHSSTQHPTEIQKLVAAMLEVPQASVICECRRMGGAFGGKESQAAQWACLAALAAQKTGRPAKLRLDRDDDMIMTGKRHEFKIDYACGFDGNGRIQVVDTRFASRCGYSADLSLGVNDRCLFHADNSYFYSHYRLRSRRLRTHTVSNTAFQHMMQSIAIRGGHDALDVRRANLYGRDADRTPYGMTVDSNHNPVAEILDTLAADANYRNRRQSIDRFNQQQRFLRKGIAITPVKFGIAFSLKHLNQTGALVHVYTDGSVEVNHGGTEMGQGLNTKVRQVAATAFGIAVDQVRVVATRTDKVPNTTPTAASSGSDLNGMATLRAAGRIRQRMADVFAARFGIASSDVKFARGRVEAGRHHLGFAEVAELCFLNRVGLSEVDHYATPKITWDRESQTGRPFLYFAYGAAISEVCIDVSTGEMRVDGVDILHDAGRSLNPAIDIGQIEGAFVQGLGWLTTEEMVIDDAGRVRTHAPSTYKIPTSADVPEHFNVRLFESAGCEEDTVFRSKAVGEPPLMLAISVYCAIMDAIASLRPRWVPPLNAPATAEAIMTAVRAAEE